MTMLSKKCAHCGKDFNAKRAHAIYCGSTCRSQATIKRQKAEGSWVPRGAKSLGAVERHTPKRMDLHTPSGLDVQSAFVISSLNKEVDRWERMYNEERTGRKALKADKERLEREFEKFKSDKALQEAQGSKPSGLSGFLQSDLVRELVPHVAPHIVPAFMGMVDMIKGKAAGINAGGEVDATGQWVMAQSPEVQQALRSLIQQISQVPPASIIQVIARLQNLLKKGNVMGGMGNTNMNFSNGTTG